MTEKLSIGGNQQTESARSVGGRRGISADTALRFERAFGVSAQFWLNLQQQYDLIKASQRAGDLDKIQMIAD